MKNTIIILALLMITSVVYGQRSSFDLSLQLGNSFRTIGSVTDFNRDNDIIGTQGLHESKVNYGIDLGYNYKINNQWVIKTGVSYTTYGYYTTNLTDARWPSDHDGSGGFVDTPGTPNELVSSIDHSFVGVPLLLRYQIGNRNLSPYIEMGPSVMLLASSTYNDLQSVNTTVSDNYNAINVFGRASLGLNYTLSSQAQMFGAITYNQQLNNIWQEDFSERLNSYGLQVGMRVKFGSQSRSSCCKPKSCCPGAEKACGEVPE